MSEGGESISRVWQDSLLLLATDAMSSFLYSLVFRVSLFQLKRVSGMPLGSLALCNENIAGMVY